MSEGATEQGQKVDGMSEAQGSVTTHFGLNQETLAIEIGIRTEADVMIIRTEKHGIGSDHRLAKPSTPLKACVAVADDLPAQVSTTLKCFMI